MYKQLRLGTRIPTSYKNYNLVIYIWIYRSNLKLFDVSSVDRIGYKILPCKLSNIWNVFKNYKPAKDPSTNAPSKFSIWSCCIILLSAKLSSVWMRPFNDTNVWESGKRAFKTDSTNCGV